jgi:hypothetical protein
LILSPTGFCGFGIQTEIINNELVLQIGKEDDLDPLNVRYLALAGWHGVSATHLFRINEIELTNKKVTTQMCQDIT